MRNPFTKNKAHIHGSSAGFTLIETLVAVAILMIAIAGPLTVAEKSLSASIYARDQLIGSYLAQDAMEYIKNTVDTNEIKIHQNLIDPSSWLGVSNTGGVTDLSNCLKGEPCNVDTTFGNEGVGSCAGGAQNCQSLWLSSNGYSQSQANGSASPFTRYFYLEGTNIDGSVCTANVCDTENVVVEVTWPGDITGGGGVILQDTIFNTQLQ